MNVRIAVPATQAATVAHKARLCSLGPPNRLPHICLSKTLTTQLLLIATCAACPKMLAPTFEFPAGIYDVAARPGTHDCLQDPVPFVRQELGVFKIGTEGRRVPLVYIDFDDERGEVWQDIDRETMEATSAGGVGCGDEPSRSMLLVASLITNSPTAFTMQATTTFDSGITCLPVPTDGCRIAETFTFDLVEECPTGTKADRGAPGTPWACVPSPTGEGP